MGPGDLQDVLGDLRHEEHADLLVGLGRSDDAAVYRVTDDVAIVETVDFFPPIVDDPYLYGAIAAANSMSDVYAKGGSGRFALAAAGFPRLRPARPGEGDGGRHRRGLHAGGSRPAATAGCARARRAGHLQRGDGPQPELPGGRARGPRTPVHRPRGARGPGQAAL